MQRTIWESCHHWWYDSFFYFTNVYMKKLEILQFQISRLNLEIQKYQNQLDQLQSQIEAMDQFVKEHPLPDDLLNLNIRDLSLSTRTCNALLGYGIRQVRDIRYCSYDDLRQINNFGPVCLTELRVTLNGIGVVLAD